MEKRERERVEGDGAKNVKKGEWEQNKRSPFQDQHRTD